MVGLAKSSTTARVYHVVDSSYGIHVLFSGSLRECRDYCREHGYSSKIRWDW